MGSFLATVGGTAFFIFYMLLGLVQLAAVMTGLEVGLGFQWLPAAFCALLIAYIPVVGTVAGFVGAMTGWGWEGAAALFFGPWAAMITFGVLVPAILAAVI